MTNCSFLMNAKYPINSECPFVDQYIPWNREGGHVEYFTIRRGKIIDIQETQEGITYTVDPWASGHFGHKRYNVPEDRICPTEGKIKELRAIASVKTCEGWLSKKSKTNAKADSREE